LGRHRSDNDVTAIVANTLELREAGKIDQMLGSCKPQLHHWNKAMPAGECTPLLAELSKQAYGFLDRSRSVICKSSWYHMYFPSDRLAPHLSFSCQQQATLAILRRFAQHLFYVTAVSITIATPITSATSVWDRNPGSATLYRHGATPENDSAL